MYLPPGPVFFTARQGELENRLTRQAWRYLARQLQLNKQSGGDSEGLGRQYGKEKEHNKTDKTSRKSRVGLQETTRPRSVSVTYANHTWSSAICIHIFIEQAGGERIHSPETLDRWETWLKRKVRTTENKQEETADWRETMSSHEPIWG